MCGVVCVVVVCGVVMVVIVVCGVVVVCVCGMCVVWLWLWCVCGVVVVCVWYVCSVVVVCGCGVCGVWLRVWCVVCGCGVCVHVVMCMSMCCIFVLSKATTFKPGNFVPSPPPPFQDAKHICDLICGKKLQCGQHSCLEQCHKGHCEKCWEYSEFSLD